MDFMQFLNELEVTLDQIEVKGKNNHDRMMGIYIEIDRMRQAIMMASNEANKDGEEDGGQTDIGATGSIDSKDK